MRERPYRRGPTRLSGPLRVAVALAGVAFVSWVVAVLSQLEALAWPLFGSLVGIVVAVGVHLLRRPGRVQRAFGALLLTALVVGLALLGAVLWYGSQICDSCD